MLRHEGIHSLPGSSLGARRVCGHVCCDLAFSMRGAIGQHITRRLFETWGRFWLDRRVSHGLPVCARKKRRPAQGAQCRHPRPPNLNVEACGTVGAESRCETNARSCLSSCGAQDATLEFGGRGGATLCQLSSRRFVFARTGVKCFIVSGDAVCPKQSSSKASRTTLFARLLSGGHGHVSENDFDP